MDAHTPNTSWLTALAFRHHSAVRSVHAQQVRNSARAVLPPTPESVRPGLA